MRYDPETERFIMDVPTHCPRCNSALEVDTRYGEEETIKTFLICSNDGCDYELDATEEFEKAAEAYGLDEEEFTEENESDDE